MHPHRGRGVDQEGRIAFIGADRQVHVADPRGEHARQVTFAKIPSALSMWGGSEGRDGCSWPCWSPCGQWLACFQMTGSEDQAGPASVCAVQVDGVEERHLADLTGQLPIYAQWNPQGSRLAVLAQEQDELQLWTCRLGEVGHRRVVDQGVPLFFSWTPDGVRLLVHVGGGRCEGGRLILRDPDGQGEDKLFPDPAGSFCTPIYAGDHAIFVVSHGAQSMICASQTEGEPHRSLAVLDGLLAIVPSPNGDHVAYASAPEGENTPYQGIWMVPTAGGDAVELTDEPCMSFFWEPTGRRLVYVVRDRPANCMQWRVVDVQTRQVRRLGPFWPSRDQLFFLHFFEQYSQSHRPISPDGRTLVYSGHQDPASLRGVANQALIQTLDLTGGEEGPRIVGEGSFAVFSPC